MNTFQFCFIFILETFSKQVLLRYMNYLLYIDHYIFIRRFHSFSTRKEQFCWSI